jgi:tight adherence protein B
MSSSLKAGLSMLQAFAVVAEELPAPISQEVGLVLKETHMGISLEEALAHLKRRIPSKELTLFVTAVLVARESGGDVTYVFGRLVETLRDRRKLKERIKTLTFMSRLQAMLMALLPFVFGLLVSRLSPDYFQFFVTDPLGRTLLMVVLMLWSLGGLLFLRFSRRPM